jgi:hypothetical protein
VVKCSEFLATDSGPGFDFWRYQIFWEVVGLERGPLSLVSTIEEMLGRNSGCSGVEIWEYGRRDPSRWPSDTLHLQKLALTSLTSDGRSVSIIRLWTQAMEFLLLLLPLLLVPTLGFIELRVSTSKRNSNLPQLQHCVDISFWCDTAHKVEISHIQTAIWSTC